MTLIKQRLAVFLFLFALCSGNVQAQTWAPEHQFSTTEGFSAHVAADANGHAVAVWAEAAGNVWASYFSNGAWGPSVIIGTPPIGEEFNSIQVAMDASGKALAVWAQFPAGGVWAASFSGGTWGPQTLISSDEIVTNISVSMDGSGKGIAAWDANSGAIEAAFFNGTTWLVPTTIALSGINPSAALSSAGTALITWTNVIPGEIASSFFNGSTWSPGAVISTGTGNGFSDVGIAANGTGLAVWNNSIEIFAARFNGSTWLAPIVLSTGVDNLQARIAVQADGRATAVWIQGLDFVQAALFNGSVWTAPTVVAAIAGGNPEVAMDGNGNAVVVWSSGEAPNFQIWSAFLTAGDANIWLPPRLIATSAIPLFDPFAAYSAGGIAFAVWNNFNDDDAFDTFGSFITAVVGFTGRSCRDRFVWQTDCVHILTWTPTADPTVVSYRLRRNGVVIANIPATGPYTYIDHNRCNQTDVYALTTVDNLGVEGIPAFVTLR